MDVPIEESEFTTRSLRNNPGGGKAGDGIHHSTLRVHLKSIRVKAKGNGPGFFQTLENGHLVPARGGEAQFGGKVIFSGWKPGLRDSL